MKRNVWYLMTVYVVFLLTLVTGVANAGVLLGDREMEVVYGGCTSRCVDFAQSSLCNKYNCATPSGGCDSNHPCSQYQWGPGDGEDCTGCDTTAGGTPDCRAGALQPCGAIGGCWCDDTHACVWNYGGPACHIPSCDKL